MPRLIAVDMPLGDAFVQAVQRVWNDGDAVLPLDQRLNSSSRWTLARELGADALLTNHGSSAEQFADASRGVETEVLPPLIDDDALVIATSGSTGTPKGVVHTHRSLAHHARMVAERLEVDSRTHWWLALPPAHIGGFGVLARALIGNLALSTSQRIDEESVRTARRGGATHTAVVPTHLRRHRFDEWQVVLVGGAHSDSLPENAVSTYGLTETGGGVIYDGIGLRGVEWRLDEGEILLRCPSMARTYRHLPLPLDDGWLRTGDLGRVDSDMLRVEGRRDDLIITGGNKVWPHPVEECLREHPLVADAAVRGVPDEEWGSLVCAWIVPQSSTNAPSLEQLRRHVKDSMAEYCAPRKLVYLGEIPRSALGKLRTADLPRS